MTQYYESVDPVGQLLCQRCQIPMVKGEVYLAYLGNSFPVELPKCPQCKIIFVPEELAVGKILRVEKSLEDK